MIDMVAIRKKVVGEDTPTRGTNASLWLNKCLQDYDQDESKGKLVGEVARLPEPPEYRAFFERWKRTLTQDYGAQPRRVQAKGRMIVGLGSESVLETSICLHRIYGMPYIPGSAIKGLAASYAHQRLGEGWRKGETYYNLIFGDTDNAGYITFFDALYQPGSGVDHQALYPDVITVHHKDYYQDARRAGPSDTNDPNPVPFLSATGTYLFALAAPAFSTNTRWLDLTFHILEKALDQFGIGAKTSSGYGRMEFLDPPARPIDPEARMAARYKEEIEGMRGQDVAGQISNYHRKWQQLTSEAARVVVAQAIIKKVRETPGREKASAEKGWYRELQAFLSVDQS